MSTNETNHIKVYFMWKYHKLIVLFCSDISGHNNEVVRNLNKSSTVLRSGKETTLNQRHFLGFVYINICNYLLSNTVWKKWPAGTQTHMVWSRSVWIRYGMISDPGLNMFIKDRQCQSHGSWNYTRILLLAARIEVVL